jgi:hypothetical protein
MNRKRNTFVVRCAAAGFFIAAGLYVYGGYLTRHRQATDSAVALILRHPSFSTDRAAGIQGLIGWLFIGVLNATSCAVVGAGISEKLELK